MIFLYFLVEKASFSAPSLVIYYADKHLSFCIYDKLLYVHNYGKWGTNIL